MRLKNNKIQFDRLLRNVQTEQIAREKERGYAHIFARNHFWPITWRMAKWVCAMFLFFVLCCVCKHKIDGWIIIIEFWCIRARTSSAADKHLYVRECGRLSAHLFFVALRFFAHFFSYHFCCSLITNGKSNRFVEIISDISTHCKSATMKYNRSNRCVLLLLSLYHIQVIGYALAIWLWFIYEQ